MLEKNRKILQDELKNVSFDVPLAPLTYYKIGGNADAVVVAETESEIVDAIKLVRELGLPYFVLGCGSNLLISDRGYPGLVIRFGAPFEEINISGTILQAGAAVKLILSFIAPPIWGFRVSSNWRESPVLWAGRCL